MNTLQLILSIVVVLLSLVLTVLVLVQNNKSEGLDAMVGSAAESFFGKNKARSLDAKLTKMTVGVSIAFFVLTAVLAICF